MPSEAYKHNYQKIFVYFSYNFTKKGKLIYFMFMPTQKKNLEWKLYKHQQHI